MPVGPSGGGNSGPQFGWGSILALLAVGGLTLGGIIVLTGSLVFNEAAAPTGASGKTYVWQDSTTKKLMANVAAAGAKYIVMSPSTDTSISGLTTNKITKATSATAIGDSRITDTGSGAVAIAAPSVSVQDSDASHTLTLTPGNESASRVLSVPVLGADAKVNVSTATQTANLMQKATADGVLANSRVTDTGSGALAVAAPSLSLND